MYIFIHLSLSLSLPMYLPTYLSVCLSFSTYLSIYLSIHLSLSPSLSHTLTHAHTHTHTHTYFSMYSFHPENLLHLCEGGVNEVYECIIRWPRKLGSRLSRDRPFTCLSIQYLPIHAGCKLLKVLLPYGSSCLSVGWSVLVGWSVDL